MRKLLLFIFILTLSKTNAQVVFCPPGAEWHYTFNHPFGPEVYNEQIKYVWDTLVGSVPAKVLQHSRFFNERNMGNDGPTAIKQSGDTVFMRNARTQHAWQILYNFNVSQGHIWQNMLVVGVFSSTSIVTYTVVVDSVKFKVIDGFNLKHLYVKYHTSYGNTTATSAVIIERFGCTNFLFNFLNWAVSDGDFISGFLCYKDNTFGLKQFTSKPCDYSNLTEIGELKTNDEILKVYPNPTSEILTIERPSRLQNLEARLINLLGEEILSDRQTIQDERLRMDLGNLKNGIYFLQVLENGKLTATQKIIKQ
jgi:hypothetical protein